MFQFLFKYPIPVFTKGRFALLSAWPAWLLLVLIVVATAGLTLLIGRRLRDSSTKLTRRRAATIGIMQSVFIALLLLLLWQPAMVVGELSSRQNIIAIIVDDSRSMGIADSNGQTREAAAIAALNSGVVAGLKQRFQVRIYRLGRGLTQVSVPGEITPIENATHISEGLEQLARETQDLPVGAILLLSDGSENSTGLGGSEVSTDALRALKERRLPIHIIGFGKPEHTHDVEIEDVSIASNAIVNSQVATTVTLTQRGYEGQEAMLSVRDGDKPVMEREVTLASDGQLQNEQLFFPAGSAGAKSLSIAVDPLPGEESIANNAITRPILVSDAKRRILYVEGEPRWEYKFIRRAEEGDPAIEIVSMLRTSENKIYRQGVSDPSELANGFPVRAEDLFGYSGIIIGSVAADYFTPLQQELLREYVDRRGGGVLFLGGKSSLGDGGWGSSSLNELLPTFLPSGSHNFRRNPATVELTAAGLDSPITRLLEDPKKNAERWKKLTYLADYEDPGIPKPGATELVDMHAGHHTLPLLITQNYGNGRTAILATGGTWRWQMSEALGDPSHDLFWQQLVRWLIAESPGTVAASTPSRLLMDEGRLQLTAQVRDRTFQPAPDAHVTAHIIGPAGVDAIVEMTPSQTTAGQFQTEWTAEKPGSYLAEVRAEASNGQQEIGGDVITFQREDGVAENFHTEQNRHLLEQLASETGGRYWKLTELNTLPRDISYSDAGISIRSTKELWDAPVVFLVILGLPLIEWLLRRKWGIV